MLDDRGCRSSFLGYGDPSNPFPGVICASPNSVIVHGIPGERVLREGGLSEEQLEVFRGLLEAQLPYNCEHVVPQSWFAHKEPMRGDLHHLFACESGCNSFRSNIPYFDFMENEEECIAKLPPGRNGLRMKRLRAVVICEDAASTCALIWRST